MVVRESIVKKVKGWEFSNKNHLFIVGPFPRAKPDDMESYINPILKTSLKYHNLLQN